MQLSRRKVHDVFVEPRGRASERPPQRRRRRSQSAASKPSLSLAENASWRRMRRRCPRGGAARPSQRPGRCRCLRPLRWRMRGGGKGGGKGASRPGWSIRLVSILLHRTSTDVCYIVVSHKRKGIFQIFLFSLQGGDKAGEKCARRERCSLVWFRLWYIHTIHALPTS